MTTTKLLFGKEAAMIAGKAGRRVLYSAEITTFMLLCTLLLPGCGQQTEAVTGPTTGWVWEGSIDDLPEEKDVFDATVSCLNQHFGQRQPKPHPRLILMESEFMVMGQGPYDGYILFDPNVMYVRNSSRKLWIISHEAIHWVYQIGDSLHDKEPFQVCQQPGRPSSSLLWTEAVGAPGFPL